MPQGLTQVIAPASEPVLLEEAKDHLRVGINDDDTYIKSLVRAARQYIENLTGMQLVTATWQASYDRFPRYSQLGGLQYASEALWGQRIPQTELSGRAWPDRASFRLPRAPLQAVQSINYVAGSTGAITTLAAALYLVDTTTRPGRIAPACGQIWPIAQAQLGSVVITYLAGYGAPANVPETLKLAIKMLVSHWYEHREAVSEGPAMNSIPIGVSALLASEWDGELS